MSKTEESYTKGFVMGALIGGTVGAITALLLAPKPGSELRKDIADKSRDAYDKASKYVGDLEEDMSEVVRTNVNEGKIRAQSIVETAQKQAKELMNSAQSVLNEAKLKTGTSTEAISNKIDQVKSAANAGVEAFKDEINSPKNQL